ncbi:AraC family transcriptional regulator [Candidatus Gracilibacteria bacterium]|jgi:AraC-like DNA-binding protein|nr:AraC family transcriptional regulator [Candidatus Gracilibacteria bacterium]NJM86288.1 AraC family transcriptional regulator [Hydrococcus sp. RU_2_2]NJP18102.1 AraC family transcriptional regulator [Hydrococcus sp. CRU_1_1]
MRERGKYTKTQEQVRFWNTSDCGNVEIMRATYVTHSFPRHSHESFGIGIVEDGALKYALQEGTHVIPTGNLVIVNPGEVHWGHAAVDTGWTYRIFYPEVALLEKVVSEVRERNCYLPYFPNPNIQDKSLAPLVLKLLDTFATPCSLLERESRLLGVLAQLVTNYASDRPSFKTIGQESRAVKLAREYLETNSAYNISLEQLACLTNLKPLRLLRVFRKEIGIPPHAYLTQVRILRAKKLLSQGITIAQVAWETGFADQSHLSRHFKRLVGVSPGQYQNSKFKVHNVRNSIF